MRAAAARSGPLRAADFCGPQNAAALIYRTLVIPYKFIWTEKFSKKKNGQILVQQKQAQYCLINMYSKINNATITILINFSSMFN